MKLIVSPSLKTLIIVLCLAKTSLSCAFDQTRHTNNDSDDFQAIANQKSSCKSNAILKSQSLINFILNDMLANYTHAGGGGITSIKETVTNSFDVSIAQEERMDILTYELAIDEVCTVTLLKKSESTVSFGQ